MRSIEVLPKFHATAVVCRPADGMDEPEPTVFVIDDDMSVREALDGLFRSVGQRAELFSSVQAFMDRAHPDIFGCLVLDIRLPGRSGLDLQADLVRANLRLPIIFITGYADIRMSVRAMKAGAVEFLTKPVRHQDLLDAIRLAADRDCERWRTERAAADLRAALGVLAPRELEVLRHVVSGRLNKQIAADIGISEATVKAHRSQIMRKLQAGSVAELVRMADRLGVSGEVDWHKLAQ
jgi:FixJ family two-component response regulator